MFPLLAGGVLISFNSLQTGRHIQRSITVTRINDQLSFNSLQTGRHIQSVHAYAQLHNSVCFNSLQTGRHIQSRTLPIQVDLVQFLEKFQFPSNGKAYPKRRIRNCGALPPVECFNSLQTGRHIQRSLTNIKPKTTTPFQFPSNGKAYPKM